MNDRDRSAKTLILGIGNTILSDDAVGIVAARRLYDRLSRSSFPDEVALVESSYAGWRTVDLVAGYRKVIIIDSILSGKGAPGECFRIDRANITSMHLAASHGVGLEESLRLGEMSGMRIPADIAIYAVEVVNPFEFGETLSPEVEARLPSVVDQIIKEEGLLCTNGE